MTTCSSCDTDNIEGVDSCELCGQPLSEEYRSGPQSELAKHLLKDRIEALRPKKPLTTSTSTPLRNVLQLLVDAEVGCVLVVDENSRLAGIFSERDAIKRIGDQMTDCSDRPIVEFMTPNPQCLCADDRIAFAVHRMDLGGYRHVPITDGEGRPVGIVSVRDILGYLADRSE